MLEPEGEKATVSLIKVPVNVSSSYADSRGPILVNPGGPVGPPYPCSSLLSLQAVLHSKTEGVLVP